VLRREATAWCLDQQNRNGVIVRGTHARRGNTHYAANRSVPINPFGVRRVLTPLSRETARAPLDHAPGGLGVTGYESRDEVSSEAGSEILYAEDFFVMRIYR
jgi:hypothetical protein